MAAPVQPDPPAFLPRAFLVAAGLTVPVAIQEASAGAGAWVLAARAATILAFLATGLALRGIASPELRRHLVRGVMVASIVLTAPTLVALGGLRSSTIWLLAATPFFLAMVLPDRRSIAAVALACAGSALGAIRATGGALVDALPWIVHLGISTAGAFWAASAWRRVCAAQAREAEAHLDAAKRMADLEREHAYEERFATVGRMVAGLAHEINNPLAVIRANVEFLQEDQRGVGAPMSPQERSELLADALESSIRIQRLVSDMREFTRKSDPTTRAPVVEVVESSVRLARAAAAGTVTISMETDGTEPVAVISRARLEQVLMSVFMNALDALESARTARPGFEPWIHVSLRQEGRESRLRIADNGTGFPDFALPRVFEPFFTTKEPGKGTGLGLALSRELVKQAGGRITVANGTDGGAVIEIFLPIPAEPADERTSDSPAA